MDNAVRFGKPSTYGGRKQIEATIGEWPEQRRLVIRQAYGERGLWDVETPRHSSTALHGPTTSSGGGVLAWTLPLRVAKRIAAEWLNLQDGKHLPMVEDTGIL